jgi:hypothetical protein
MNEKKVSVYKVLSRLFTLRWQLKKQERYVQGHLLPLLTSIEPDYQREFPGHIKRATKYWQLSLNLVCESLYKLCGKKLQPGEHHRIMLLSAFGPLFDDLFDDRILEHEQIELLVMEPEAYAPVNRVDRLVKDIYLQLLAETPHPRRFVQHLYELFRWEKESLKQLGDDVSEEELYQITYNKSYYAVLLYCAVLDHYPANDMLEMLYLMAGLMQLTNDIFDVWKDVHKGIYTLPNLYRNFEQLQQQFMADTASFNQKLWQLPYTQDAKQTYAITIHSLHAMGWLALQQLKETAAGISSFEELKTLSRKALVCDMDHIGQQLRWLKYIRYFANYHVALQPAAGASWIWASPALTLSLNAEPDPQ